MVGTRAGEERKKVQTGEGEKGHKGGRRGKEGGGGEEGKLLAKRRACMMEDTELIGLDYCWKVITK